MLGRNEVVLVLVGFVAVVTAGAAGFLFGYGNGLDRLAAASASASVLALLSIGLEMKVAP